jgi:hypothetical protein
MPDKDTVIGVRLRKALRNRLKNKANAENRTMSSQARVYIEQGLDRDGLE